MAPITPKPSSIFPNSIRGGSSSSISALMDPSLTTPPHQQQQTISPLPFTQNAGVSPRPFPLLRRKSLAIADTFTAKRRESDLQSPKQFNRRRHAQPSQGTSETSPLLAQNPAVNGDNVTKPSAETSIKVKIDKLTQTTREFVKSPQFKNILKCSIAYFLGSMIVYSPIREIFGKSQNKHLAATVAVYFHPARTAGSMYESIFFVLLSLLYSLLMVTSSMFLSREFHKAGLKYWGYTIDILFFCGFGLGYVAFIKQKIGKQTFNTACSVAAIFLVTSLTKEGNIQAGVVSMERVFQSFFLVFSGVVISTVVCFLLWPKYALAATKQELNRAMEINASMLKYLTQKFMKSETIHSTEYNKLKSQSASSYQTLTKNLTEAAYELLLAGKEEEYNALVDLTSSSHKLSLLFNGLGSSVLTQWSLLSDELDSTTTSSTEISDNEDDNTRSGDTIFTPGKLLNSSSNGNSSFNDYSAIVDEEAVENFFNPKSADTGKSSSNDFETFSNSSATAVFKQFTRSIGPFMTRYSSYLQKVMSELPFEKSTPYNISSHLEELSELERILLKYSRAREKHLYDLYKRDSFALDPDFESVVSKEAEAASCGNFSYILEEIGNELKEFMKRLEQYQKIVNKNKLNFKKSYAWIWKLRRGTKPRAPVGSIFVDVTKNTLNKSLESKYDKINRVRSKQKLNEALDEGIGENGHVGGPEKPSIALKIWRSLRAFRRPDIQFGIKVGLGASIFALPAFSDRFRPTYSGWRGEWGLITFVIIMNKSVGGTANTVPIRILGTFLGAAIAWTCWTLFPENDIVLPILGFFLSFWCFWIILYWKSKNMFGRFILLTFNLTVLYSYSLSISDNDDDEDTTQLIVRDIAFHRFVSVCAGVLWALLISTFILPNSARRKLKRGLSILWLQMGLVWKADALRTQPRKGSTEYRFTGIQGENAMQLVMIELNSLLTMAPNELRLKGPFPKDEYSALLKYTQQILDVFQDISVLIAKDPKASSRELEIIEYTTLERAELCNRIFLNFYLLSSAMRLGFPLPDKMPSTEHAIDRMLIKLNEYRAVNIKDLDTDVSFASDTDNEHALTFRSLNDPENTSFSQIMDSGYVEDFILFYSYILVTIGITEQLAGLAIHIQNLFGVIEEEMFEV